jgi:hypothetical protein
VDLARLLIDHGADVSGQDDHGFTPLCFASSRGDRDLAGSSSSTAPTQQPRMSMGGPRCIMRPQGVM